MSLPGSVCRALTMFFTFLWLGILLCFLMWFYFPYALHRDAEETRCTLAEWGFQTSDCDVDESRQDFDLNYILVMNMTTPVPLNGTMVAPTADLTAYQCFSPAFVAQVSGGNMTGFNYSIGDSFDCWHVEERLFWLRPFFPYPALICSIIFSIIVTTTQVLCIATMLSPKMKKINYQTEISSMVRRYTFSSDQGKTREDLKARLLEDGLAPIAEETGGEATT
eukprot:gnl/Hemi2/12309_TR4214_c1_g2_i1.p1 gnl/Hemi2/12309_TR4214_c1_g2~~gnl/Hemi2/12309_TR4214_c1_g2_i1.p1  ORF type:complete len:222 (+),score=75.63 gnl/Hemi2/12309_TR4214_c1_g2_i1:169-834(+)